MLWAVVVAGAVAAALTEESTSTGKRSGVHARGAGGGVHARGAGGVEGGPDEHDS